MMAKLSKAQVTRLLWLLEDAEREADAIKPTAATATPLGIVIGKLSGARSIILDALATEIELERV